MPTLHKDPFAPVTSGLVPLLTPDDYYATATAWEPTEIGPSAAEGYTADPDAVRAQMEALRSLQAMADSGFTRSERRQLERDYAAGDGLARSGDEGIANRRAYAGETDNRLLQQQSAQESQVARSAFDRDVGAAADTRRRSATEALSGLSGDIRRGSFADASRAGQLQDILNRARADFSTLAAQQNAQNANRVAEANSGAGERYASDTLGVGQRQLEESDATRERMAQEEQDREDDQEGPFTTMAGVGGAVFSTALGAGPQAGWQAGTGFGRGIGSLNDDDRKKGWRGR